MEIRQQFSYLLFLYSPHAKHLVFDLTSRNVTTFPDVAISFFRIKGISIIFIIAYQNLVSDAIMKVSLK